MSIDLGIKDCLIGSHLVLLIVGLIATLIEPASRLEVMTVHIGANKGDIAETILLPGDPLRAKWVAENMLEGAVQYNSVRNMFGYTGTYKGNRVSVQGTGMGIPSISIYVTELFKDFDVQTAIRIGTCGGLGKTQLRDVIIGMAASSDSGVNRRATGGLDFAPIANYDLLKAAVDAAAAHGVTYHVGGIASMDLFYDDSNALDILEAHGVLGVEMEASGLYTIAAKYGRRALAICTVSDMIRTHEKTSSEERETGFKAMVEVALEAAFA